MQEKGTTILFVSHSLAQVEKICDKIVWLEKGHLKMFGDAGDICRIYAES